MVSTGCPSPLLNISANVIFFVLWEPLAFLASQTCFWISPVPHPPLQHTPVQIPDMLYIILSPSIPDPALLLSHPLFLPSTLHPLPVMTILFLLLRRTEESTHWSYFLSFILSVNCILGILSFWANIHLPVSAYHV